jgi:putative oxidoreductase
MSFDETSFFFLCLRIILGIVFIYHGYTKINSKQNLDEWNTYITSKGFNSFVGTFVAYIELFLGIFIIFGLFTSITSILIAIYMVCAIYISHYGSSVHTYFYQICLLILAILVIINSNNKYSIDNIIKNSK